MSAAAVELSPEEQGHWSAERGRAGTSISEQVAITWRALATVRAIGTKQEQGPPAKTSSVLGTPIPVKPVATPEPWTDVDPAEYFEFPQEFDRDEMRTIFSNEIRTHDSDGGPLSVYFGPTRVHMLADLAIETYGQAHSEAIHGAASTVISAYMAKF